MPSRVVIFFPETEPTSVMHDRVARPSMMTVQAPHWPSPHPYLLAVRFRSSRSTSRRLRSASVLTCARFPLMFKVMLAIGFFNLQLNIRYGAQGSTGKSVVLALRAV